MAVSPQELGRRLREAREASGMTQEQVSRELGLSRASVAQMELGNRQVNSLELDRLAYLYGRDIRQFLAETFQPQDALTVLLRANPDLTRDGKVAEGLRRCIALGREISNLETLLGIERDAMAPAAYPTTSLKSKWDAIQQGGRVALEERRRLNLGDSPLPDISEILDSQGIRIAFVPLPNDVSGLTIHEAGVGIFVAVNSSHSPLRRRFSFAHEYAHVLLDREVSRSIISRGDNRAELIEMRANSFAAVFLMPDEGRHWARGNLADRLPMCLMKPMSCGYSEDPNRAPRKFESTTSYLSPIDSKSVPLLRCIGFKTLDCSTTIKSNCFGMASIGDWTKKQPN